MKYAYDLTPEFVAQTLRTVRSRSRGAGLNWHDQEDIAQDLIFAAVRAAGGDKDACERNIVMNTRRASYYSRARKRAKHASRHELDDSATGIASPAVLTKASRDYIEAGRRPGSRRAPSGCGTAGIEDAEWQIFLDEVLNSVPASHAAGWRLVRLEGNSISEAAAKLGVSYGKAYSMIDRTDSVLRNRCREAAAS